MAAIIEFYDDEMDCEDNSYGMDLRPVMVAQSSLERSPENGQSQGASIEGVVWQGRKRMLSLLQTRLEKKRAKGDMNPAIAAADPDQNTKLLSQLEALMFATAPSWEDYTDESTIDDRLKAVFVSILRRRLDKMQYQE